MTQHPNFGFAVEYVDDIETAKRFYVDVVGLEVERTHPTFVQFPNFAIASDQSMNGSRETELYWLVDDAEAAFAELSEKAEVTLPIKQMPFGKVFGIKGAAGEPRYLLELAANRPSQQRRAERAT
jgi:catechol 2,3-dioxygenase-like lactoylglutathione lyase family enzyme